jgi:hypothetical protein
MPKQFFSRGVPSAQELQFTLITKDSAYIQVIWAEDLGANRQRTAIYLLRL